MKLHLPNSALINNIESFMKSLDTTDSSQLKITSNPDWVHVHPVVLCMVASLGLSVRNNGGNIDFEIMQSKTSRYFKRMGLFQFLNLDYGDKIEEHEEAGRFIPLTVIQDNNNLTRFLTEIIPILHTKPEQAAPMRYILSELIRNVIEHSGSSAIVCAQRYPKGKIRIGVVDSGKGIKKALNFAYPEIKDHKKAMEYALTPGITGTTKKLGGSFENGGGGLFIIKSIAKINRDFFMLYSGDVMYKLLQEKQGKNYELNTNPFKDKCHLKENLPFWSGTVAGIDISMNNRIDWEELFKLVKRAYGTKTKEQIKAKYKARFTNGN